MTIFYNDRTLRSESLLCDIIWNLSLLMMFTNEVTKIQKETINEDFGESLSEGWLYCL